VVIGNGIPKMYAGLNATVFYKGFDLYINFRGAFKFQVWNQFRSHYENFSVIGSYNIPRSTFDRPYGGTAYNTQASAYNSYFIENGDFVKLDNISLGYTFKVPKSWSISKLRVYVSGLNLHTFTKYSGLDPEVSMLGLYPGIEPYDAYPKTTTFTMGLNVTF
jgi:TonB-dependent starch-binding outer membrane protein SusC